MEIDKAHNILFESKQEDLYLVCEFNSSIPKHIVLSHKFSSFCIA